MTKNTPSGTKKHHGSTEPESRQTAKMLLLLLFFFFFFFFIIIRQASSNLRDSFAMLFAQNSSIFTEQCTSSSLFSRFEVTQGNSNRSLKNYGFLYDAIFFPRVRMRINYLATILCKIAELEILLVCWESLKKAWDSSANTA